MGHRSVFGNTTQTCEVRYDLGQCGLAPTDACATKVDWESCKVYELCASTCGGLAGASACEDQLMEKPPGGTGALQRRHRSRCWVRCFVFAPVDIHRRGFVRAPFQASDRGVFFPLLSSPTVVRRSLARGDDVIRGGIVDDALTTLDSTGLFSALIGWQ